MPNSKFVINLRILVKTSVEALKVNKIASGHPGCARLLVLSNKYDTQMVWEHFCIIINLNGQSFSAEKVMSVLLWGYLVKIGVIIFCNELDSC